MSEVKKIEEPRKRKVAFWDQVAKESIQYSNKKARDDKMRKIEIDRFSHYAGAWDPSSEIVWFFRQQFGCLGCGKKDEGCRKLPPFFVEIKHCLCCDQPLFEKGSWHHIWNPWMKSQRHFDCFTCHQWLKMSNERFKINQEGINEVDIDTVFQQLQTDAGLAIIEHATRVEDKVKGMNWLRKLLEKQRIEMNFVKK